MSEAINSGIFRNYRIVIDGNTTNCINADHSKKELHISKDVNFRQTDDGKLFAEFANFRKDENKTFLGFKLSSEQPKYDCSITISDPTYFNSCFQKDGVYQISADDVVFNGTKNDDKVILKQVSNSKINLGDGKDTVLIKSASPKDQFFNNVINTGNGADSVDVSGNFNKFYNNKFYLGKGSDSFSASINPDDDAKTRLEFESKLPKHASTVAKNEIYAIAGYTKAGDKKGWLEKNTFDSKTHCANQLIFKNAEPSASVTSDVDGFQEYKFKPEPKNQIVYNVQQSAQKDKSKESVPFTYEEKCMIRYGCNSLLHMLYNKKGAQEEAFNAVGDMVNSWDKKPNK